MRIFFICLKMYKATHFKQQAYGSQRYETIKLRSNLVFPNDKLGASGCIVITYQGKLSAFTQLFGVHDTFLSLVDLRASIFWFILHIFWITASRVGLGARLLPLVSWGYHLSEAVSFAFWLRRDYETWRIVSWKWFSYKCKTSPILLSSKPQQYNLGAVT